MAIKRTEDMDFAGIEMPRRPTLIPSKSDPAALRESILKNNPEDTPIMDPGVREELPVIQALKLNQLNVQEAPGFKHLAGIKTKVIWYNQTEFVQNTDIMNAGGLNSVDGRKYNRIENMLIVTDSELAQSFSVEDDGTVKNQITASGLTYPGFSPYPNDFFFAYETLERGTLYHVTNVEPVSPLEGGGFKIEFEKYYEQMDPDQMGNLVEGSYVFNFESVGTKNNVVIERSMFTIYSAACNLFDKISEEYISRFFDEHKNIIRYRFEREEHVEDGFVSVGTSSRNVTSSDVFPPGIDKAFVFDPYVMYFIATQFKESKLKHGGYSVIPTNPVWIDDAFKDVYKYSIFNALARRDPKLIKFHEYSVIPFSPRTTKELSYSGWFRFELLRGKPVDKQIVMYPKSLIQNIVSNTLYTEQHDSGEDIKYNMLVKFMNEKRYIPLEEDLKAFESGIEFMPNNILYGVAPLLLHVSAYYKQLLLSKTL